jgi:hypothetical protein
MRIRNEAFLTAIVARALLDYDPSTGAFTWRAREPKSDRDRRTMQWNETHAGRAAGHVDDLGVTRIVIFSRAYLAGRLAWLIVRGRWPKRPLRFKDGSPRNLRIENLIMPKPCEVKRNKTSSDRRRRNVIRAQKMNRIA